MKSFDHALFCFFLLLFVIPAHALNTDSIYNEGTLHVEIDVFSHNTPLKGFRYDVVIDNEIIASNTVENRSSVELTFPYGHSCAVLFYAEEHHMKFVLLETYTANELTPDHDEFSFEVSLLKTKYIEKIDHDILDYPAGIIRVEEGENHFDYAEKYYMNLSKEYLDLRRRIERYKRKSYQKPGKRKR